MLAGAAVAIDRLAVPVTLRRSAIGTYVGGLWVPGGATETTVAACVYAISPEQARNLPEGIRADAEWIAWSRHELRGPSEDDGRPGDEIVYRGRRMRVVYVWDRVEGGFWRAALRTVVPE